MLKNMLENTLSERKDENKKDHSTFNISKKEYKLVDAESMDRLLNLAGFKKESKSVYAFVDENIYQLEKAVSITEKIRNIVNK